VRRLALGAPLVLAVALAASASAQEGAGKVSRLTGQATVTRAPAPAPAALRVNDAVFVHDRLATAERSWLQVLLGGRATITVRELSVLTITEQRDRAAVNLETGRIAFAQSKRPGAPPSEIRTPNAVAAVRGTVVVIESRRLSGPAPDGGPPFQSDIAVTKDGPVDVRIGGSQVTLQYPQALSVVGNTMTGVRLLTPAEVSALIAAFTPPRAPGAVPPSAQGALKAQQQSAAAEDAAALSGKPGALLDTPDTINKQVPILPQVSPRRCVGGYC
jgi:hypothetical protein